MISLNKKTLTVDQILEQDVEGIFNQTEVQIAFIKNLLNCFPELCHKNRYVLYACDVTSANSLPEVPELVAE